MLQDRFELNLDPLELENVCPFAKSTIRNEVGQQVGGGFIELLTT